MTELKKAVVPEEIALRLQEFDGEPVLYDIEGMATSPYGGIKKLYQFYRQHPRDYFSALINGYQVEKSPEEKLREYYEILKEGSCADVARSTQRSFHDTMEGVIKTLKILGITIEGINAK